MKKVIAVCLLVGIAFLASLPRRTCFKGDFQEHAVQVDTVTKWGKTTSFVVLRPTSEIRPIIMGYYEKGECSFLTLSNPLRFVAQPATSSDTIIKQAYRLLEIGRTAVQVDEYIVHDPVRPLWVRFVPFRLL